MGSKVNNGKLNLAHWHWSWVRLSVDSLWDTDKNKPLKPHSMRVALHTLHNHGCSRTFRRWSPIKQQLCIRVITVKIKCAPGSAFLEHFILKGKIKTWHCSGLVLGAFTKELSGGIAYRTWFNGNNVPFRTKTRWNTLDKHYTHGQQPEQPKNCAFKYI